MFLYRLYLNPRCRGARRDLANPYELHSTLCRAFSTPEVKCLGGAFLWRLEASKDQQSTPQILLQSSLLPDWKRIGEEDWFLQIPDEPLNLQSQLALDALKEGLRFRFRLRANPSVCRGGKRLGLLHVAEQKRWLVQKGLLHGFELPSICSFALDGEEDIDVLISQEHMLRGLQRTGNAIKIYSVQFDGVLTVTNVERFRLALQSGIGHGKTMGLGLLSVVPVK